MRYECKKIADSIHTGANFHKVKAIKLTCMVFK